MRGEGRRGMGRFDLVKTTEEDLEADISKPQRSHQSDIDLSAS